MQWQQGQHQDKQNVWQQQQQPQQQQSGGWQLEQQDKPQVQQYQGHQQQQYQSSSGVYGSAGLIRQDGLTQEQVMNAVKKVFGSLEKKYGCQQLLTHENYATLDSYLMNPQHFSKNDELSMNIQKKDHYVDGKWKIDIKVSKKFYEKGGWGLGTKPAFTLNVFGGVKEKHH